IHARKLVVGPGALVCQEAHLTGNVSIGCVLHPKCSIIADVGPIVIGRNNILEEGVVIINRWAILPGAKIGNRNTFEARSRVVGATTVGSHCVVGIGCQTEPDETMPDFTVIYGDRLDRRICKPDAAHAALHLKHLEYLRDMLPKFNHMRPVA
ncbi:trimeric LpxA-like protein, partial [Syncephalis pseudoplumigaleata]